MRSSSKRFSLLVPASIMTEFRLSRLARTRLRRSADTLIFEYYLKDHLGNTRVMFTDSDGNGQPEALQEDHYYPFGLKMADGAMQPSQATVHLYNGKELQDELGLNWIDYGARMLNPRIGR